MDPALLHECAALLPGTHDFTAFTRTQTSHSHFNRTIMRSEWLEEPDDVLAYWIEADAFLRGMVRALVGTMLTVSAGRMEVEEMAALLEGGHRRRGGRQRRPPTGSTSSPCATELPSRPGGDADELQDGLEGVGHFALSASPTPLSYSCSSMRAKRRTRSAHAACEQGVAPG